MSNLSSSSSITPTPSTFHNTPTATHPNSVYVHTGSGPDPSNAALPPPSPSRSRIPVTPAVLRSIFASSRTALEERSLSRVAFFRYVLALSLQAESQSEAGAWCGWLVWDEVLLGSC